MSTRRTRQELIEQGVLKEVPDNGKKSSDLSLMFVSDIGNPEAILPPQTLQLKSSLHHNRCLRHILKQANSLAVFHSHLIQV